MDVNQKGCFAEYSFATTAIKKGYNVSMPLLDASLYDCILERDNKLFKIQIKYIGKNRRRHGKGYQINLKRTGKPYYELYEVDFFAIYYEDANGFFIIPNKLQHSLKLSMDGKYKVFFNNFECIS